MYYLHSSSVTYFEDYTDGVHSYVFSGPCIKTGETYTVRVIGSELYAFNQPDGGINALTSNTRDDREFLMTGLSPNGWNQLFPQEGGDA